MVCDKRGSSCEWLDVWAAWLNSERECKHWLSLASPESHDDLRDSHQDQREDRTVAECG